MHTRTYQAPQITELGSVAQLTQGESRGDKLDADYPAGTPAVNIFS